MGTGAILEVVVRATGAADPHATGYAPVYTRRGVAPHNSRGYRDLERAIPKPAGVHRVLCLGDSFTWGVGVEFDDAYPQRLERALRRRRREPWEAVSLAMPGMNSADEAAQLVAEGFAYDPDIVVLGYVLNDSEDSQAAETRRAEDWSQPRHRERRFWERSALLRLVGGRLAATAENRRRVSGYLSMYEENATGWIAAQAALRTMAAECRKRNVPFVVVIFPLFGNALDESYPFRTIHEKVARVAGQAGAQVLDLLPYYRGLRWDLLVVNGAEDEHPSEKAHRIATTAIMHAIDQALPFERAAARSEPATQP
jgi:hypothetical protein